MERGERGDRGDRGSRRRNEEDGGSEFDERLTNVADNMVGFTAMAAAVYAAASFAQLASGLAIDRFAVKPVLLTTVSLQVIMMPIVATQSDWPLFAASFVMMLAVFGFLTGRPEFLDLAILYGLLNVVATIAVLKFFRYGDLGDPGRSEERP